MKTYQLLFISNTKLGRALFGLLMLPSVFLAWTGLYHFREYEQLVPTWFFIPLLLVLLTALLKINIARSEGNFETSLTFLKWKIKSSLNSHKVKVGDVVSTSETKLKGEYQLLLGEQELNLSLVGNVEKHVVILNALMGLKK